MRPLAGKERGASGAADGRRDVGVVAEVGAEVLNHGYHRLGAGNGVVGLVVGRDDEEVGPIGCSTPRTDKRQTGQRRSGLSQELSPVGAFPLAWPPSVEIGHLLIAFQAHGIETVGGLVGYEMQPY